MNTVTNLLIAAADTARVLMINERHHAASDRVLTLRLLAPLREKGFRYFAAEAFAAELRGVVPDDFSSHARGTLREALLAVRSLLDTGIDRLETQEPKKPRKTLKITVSIGAADSTDPKESAEDVVKAADQCLYRAKETGRNKVWVRARPRI